MSQGKLNGILVPKAALPELKYRHSADNSGWAVDRVYESQGNTYAEIVVESPPIRAMDKGADIAGYIMARKPEPTIVNLEGRIDLDGRDHLYYARYSDGREELIKPYIRSERKVLSRLKSTGLTFVLEVDEKYFVERLPDISPIERALGEGTATIRQVAGLLGRALYQMHSARVVYNGDFKNAFINRAADEIKFINFSRATLASRPEVYRGDIIRVLEYLEIAAEQDRFKPKEKDQLQHYFYDAIGLFIGNYIVRSSEEGRRVFMEVVQHIIQENKTSSQLLVPALEKFIKTLARAKGADHTKSGS